MLSLFCSNIFKKLKVFFITVIGFIYYVKRFSSIFLNFKINFIEIYQVYVGIIYVRIFF